MTVWTVTAEIDEYPLPLGIWANESSAVQYAMWLLEEWNEVRWERELYTPTQHIIFARNPFSHRVARTTILEEVVRE